MGIFTSKHRTSSHREDHTTRRNYYERREPTRYEFSNLDPDRRPKANVKMRDNIQKTTTTKSGKCYSESKAKVQESSETVDRGIKSKTSTKSSYPESKAKWKGSSETVDRIIQSTTSTKCSYPESKAKWKGSSETVDRIIQSKTSTKCSPKVCSEVKAKIAKETSGAVDTTNKNIHTNKSVLRNKNEKPEPGIIWNRQQTTGKNSDFPLVIALDFGTSYSGYGYQFLDEYQKNPMDISIPQAFNGGKQNFLSQKTSTCILIKNSGEVENFGYLADERYEEICDLNQREQFYFFKHFKMKLHELKGLHTDFLLPDETRSKELPAIVVFSLAIKSLMDHAIKYIRNERGNISESGIMWALTVPAIWNESATQFMKDAAVKCYRRENIIEAQQQLRNEIIKRTELLVKYKHGCLVAIEICRIGNDGLGVAGHTTTAASAGIKRENLKIVYEPEAASFACRYLPVSTLNQRTSQSRFFEVPSGTLYMIVDLGGGTADIVIHKKIDQRRVKEISRPSGGPWGGTAVDSSFTSFLIKIVGAKVFMKFKQTFPGDYFDLMQDFEVKKRNVEQGMMNKVHIKIPSELSNICREVTGKDLQSTVQETEYHHKIQFKGGKALIDAEIFYGFFEPVAKEIVEHVKSILDSRHGSKVALLLMVGGFSESKYIQNIMKSEFQRDTMNVLIPKDPGVAVIKGAVLIAREEKLLAFRVRNVICVAAVHIGRNTTTMAIQFRDKFQHNPYEVLEVTFLDSNRMPTLHNSTCVLFDQTMNVHSVGNEAEETYKQLCFLSIEKEWHFFKDFHLQLEEQEYNFELTLRDQDNIPMRAIDILSTYISHALKHLENIYRQQDVLFLMQDTHFVFTAPADWSERVCIRLLSDAAEMAGLKEERISVTLESEAINHYCKNSKAWKNLNVAGAPIGSIIVIANLAEAKGELTFHEKRSKAAVTGAYKTVSGPWGTQSVSDGFMQTLTLILGKDLIGQFKRIYPHIYNDLCKTIELKGKSIRLDKENNVNLRFPVKTFDELCRTNVFKSFRECVEDSEYGAKIKVANMTLHIDVSLFTGIFSHVTDAIVGHVKQHQMAGEIKRNSFLALTGCFSDYEMLTSTILPKLEKLGVMTVIIKSEECPILKGAIAYGFTCE